MTLAHKFGRNWRPSRYMLTVWCCFTVVSVSLFPKYTSDASLFRSTTHPFWAHDISYQFVFVCVCVWMCVFLMPDVRNGEWMVQKRNEDYKELKAFVACHGTYSHFAKGLDWSGSLFQSSIHPPPTHHTPTIHLSFCNALFLCITLCPCMWCSGSMESHLLVTMMFCSIKWRWNLWALTTGVY